MKKKSFVIAGLLIIIVTCTIFFSTNLYSWIYTCSCINQTEVEAACQNYCDYYMGCYVTEQEDYGLCWGVACCWEIVLVCVDGKHMKTRFFHFYCPICL